MNITELKDNLPNYAKDIKLNLSQILTQDGAPDLTVKQIFYVALASALSTKNQKLITALNSSAKEHLAESDIEAAKAAVTIMAMNNIYYRFTHLVSDAELTSMPAKLRMNIIGNPGVSKEDFELACLAVSAINGCGKCMDAHVQTLLKHGTSKAAIQSAVRIASVMNATAMAMDVT